MMVMMIIIKERRINIKHVIHVEARNVQNFRHGALTHIDAANRRTRVHLTQPCLQRFYIFLADKIAFRKQNTVGKTNLISSRSLLIPRIVAVLSVYNRLTAVKTEEGRDSIVHKEGLCDWSWIGYARRLKHDII